MPAVLFIDLWPEVAKPGYWKKRFLAVPAAASQAGFAATPHHFTRLDAAHLSATPPAGIILSGSRSNLVENHAADPRNGVTLAAFAALTELLVRLPQVPVLGICFGMQYLTVAAGGALARLPANRQDPVWPIEVLGKDPLFTGIARPRCVENHSWQVARPAPGYRVIARSSDGIEGIRHERLPRAGVQFHPEYHRQPGATAHGELLLMNWLGGLA